MSHLVAFLIYDKMKVSSLALTLPRRKKQRTHGIKKQPYFPAAVLIESCSAM